MIEKLLNRIDELTLEVNQLKHSYKPEHFEVVKLEQKENIKLEIQEDEDAASEEDEVASEEDEVASEATVADLEEEVTSEAEEVASLEEEEEEEEEVATVASKVDEDEVASEVETEASSEAEEEKAEPEEEEEYIEIDIDDVTYCTNNEDNGFIYQLTEDGDVGDKVGYLKDGEPFFYADEK
jgi:S-DNA-T family DNA segregation ATPase FtsK/SpoIIIE